MTILIAALKSWQISASFQKQKKKKILLKRNRNKEEPSQLDKRYLPKKKACSSYTSVQFNYSVVPNSLWPHRPQHDRPSCPSPTPGVYSDSCPLSWWCRPTISPSVIYFSDEPVVRIRWPKYWVSVLASVLPMNIQDWFRLEWTGWMSLQSKGLSRVFSNTTVQKHQFFSAQLSL